MYLEEIIYKNSRIKILIDKKELVSKAYDELIDQRTILENYIKKDPYFLSALSPYKIKKDAPKIAKLMSEGAKIAKVGPMAAVAGTLSEFIVKKLIKEGAKTAIAENGGDIFAVTDKEITIGLFSGQNKIAEKLAFKLNKNNTPLSICSSSSKLGHSLSFGKCDLATVFSKKSYIADAVSTAVGNKVKEIKDIEPTLNWAIKLKGVQGVIIVKDHKIGMIGNIPKLLLSKDQKLKNKITKEDFYRF
ncbi:MAG: UPF0280 family protein [Nanoarchaeota archaeon]|nr:UPF0280 family protein [Nanoarchaeota archaeon]MBU1005947.1 UPF0280 family protein [Nanoarchaeota archaeon]MBU1947074.1 UPF0280 family protein [Nanoarchaeota archaeon]